MTHIAASETHAEPVKRDPDSLAEKWLTTYTVAQVPYSLRALSWMPLVGAIVVPFAPETLKYVIAVVAVSLACWIIGGLYVARRFAILRPALRELARFPDSTSQQHLANVGEVLVKATPALRTLEPRSAEQAGEVLRTTALRLMVISDIAGCGNGHVTMCAHRRNGDAWARWIAPEDYPAPAAATGASGGQE